jgi:hypothetical protein
VPKLAVENGVLETETEEMERIPAENRESLVDPARSGFDEGF